MKNALDTVMMGNNCCWMIKLMLYIDDCDDCRGKLHNLRKEEVEKKQFGSRWPILLPLN
jgi:hypothetical protein